MKLRGRTDSNQNTIVQELRKLGMTVMVISAIGNGIPDLAVGYAGQNYFFQIKRPDGPPSKRVLTPAEEEFHAAWRGQVNVIQSTEDALKVISGRIRATQGSSNG